MNLRTARGTSPSRRLAPAPLAGLVALLVIAASILLAPIAAAAPDTQTIWGTIAPTSFATSDGRAVVLGTRFTSSVDGEVLAIRVYNSPNSGRETGYLWDARGRQLTSVSFADASTSGWIEAQLSQPQAIMAGAQYTVGYLAPSGKYAYRYNTLGQGLTRTNGVLTATTGVYSYAGNYPTATYRNSAYYVDV